MKRTLKASSILFLSMFFFMAGCVGPNTKSSSAAMDELSAQQLFVLKDLSGQDVSLGTLLKSKKAVLLNFWATWCPPCREEIPGLIALQKKQGGDAFTILGVNVGESARKVSAFASKVGINYPVVLDGNMAVAEEYRVVGIPTSLLISSEGKVLGVYHAYTPELVADVEKALK